MVMTLGMNRFWQTSLLMSVLGIAAACWAQDAPETPPTPAQADNTPAVAAVPDDSGLASQVEQLRNEVDQLKQQIAYLNSVVAQLQGANTPVEQSSTNRPAASKSSTASKKKGTTSAKPAPAPIVPEGDDRAPMTVLVFHDGHKTEARNYAIVGQTLWIYTEQDSRKVPLADLDVAATKDANSDRGITFQVPPTK